MNPSVLDQHGRALPARTPRVTARYMNHDRTGVLDMRRAVTRDIKHDVRLGAERAFALAIDFMQNSGWIAGAAEQIITDMVGAELVLNARPDLSVFGGDEAAKRTWTRQVEAAWRRWSHNPAECDLAGQATVSEMLDGAIRYYLSAGEALAVTEYLPRATQRRYGIETGTKVRLVSPHRLKRYTMEIEGWEQGINFDANGRPVAYRFRRNDSGLERDLDIPAMDGALRRVLHVMDRGATPNSPRGISPMTPAFKTIAQSDQLADATLTTALLQTAFAATIHSPEASAEAFAAIETLSTFDELEGADELAEDLFAVWEQRMAALKENSLSINGNSSQVNHLGPGEQLEFHTNQTPGPQYQQFQHGLLREIARCMGVMFETLTMDFSNASYSSVRMGTSTIWPINMRRRGRIAAPMAQGIYAAWLDEQIGTGRLPFPGGGLPRGRMPSAMPNWSQVSAADWQGPAQPSADPFKDAQADKVRLETGTTTLQEIYARKGVDWEEQVDQMQREHERLVDAELPSPFGRTKGGAGGPNGGAAEPTEEEARA